MFGAGLEKDRHAKRDDGAEAYPPGKFHQREPPRLRVKFAAEDAGDVVGQTAQDCNDYEANDHRENVTKIVAAAFGKNSAEKYTKQRTVSVAENSKHDRNDAHIGMDDHEI